MQKKPIILGLDVSTAITGGCILEGEDILASYMWDTRNKKKFPNLLKKAEFINTELLSIQKDFNIDEIIIEKPFMFFNSGGSTAKTMSVLQNFNGMVSWMCYTLFGKEPIHIPVLSARKSAGLVIKRGQNSKEKVLDFIIDKYPQIEIQYTKHGNPKPGIGDMCDSIIVALAGREIVRREEITDP